MCCLRQVAHSFLKQAVANMYVASVVGVSCLCRYGNLFPRRRESICDFVFVCWLAVCSTRSGLPGLMILVGVVVS